MADLCCGDMDQYSGGWLVKRTEALLGSNLGRNSQPDGASMDGTRPRQDPSRACRGHIAPSGTCERFRLRQVCRANTRHHRLVPASPALPLAPIEHRSHA